VPIPDLIVPDLQRHLASIGPANDALVFTSATGAPLRHSNFRRRVWLPALKAAGLPAIHFHDVRHTGNKFTADVGANLRELMERMGHSSTRQLAAEGAAHGIRVNSVSPGLAGVL
jgi:integrase